MAIDNKNYKDTVFRMIFNNKQYLLDLYNAINGTNYNNPEDLTITTLSGETFLKMKNDLSFIINFELNLYEHQSTTCPNIPLRDLYYLSATLKEMIPHEKTFIEQRITIPTPRFYMFYNGITNMEDTVTYRLSEMFSRPVGDPSIELVVTALNVNEGHNKEIMEACNALKGYSIFVSKVRKYNKEAIKEYDLTHKMPLKLLADKRKITKSLVKSAINRAIDECIEEDVLRDFFIENRKEVVEMGAHEYSYEKHLQFEKEDSYNDGFSKGFNDGFNDGFSDGFSDGVDAGVQNTTELFLWLRNNGRQGDIMIALDDPDFLTTLFTEYNDSKKAGTH